MPVFPMVPDFDTSKSPCFNFHFEETSFAASRLTQAVLLPQHRWRRRESEYMESRMPQRIRGTQGLASTIPSA